MSKHDSVKPSTPEPARTETEAEQKVPFFARKLGRPALVVRTGVHGGKESREKAV